MWQLIFGMIFKKGSHKSLNFKVSFSALISLGIWKSNILLTRELIQKFEFEGLISFGFYLFVYFDSFNSLVIELNVKRINPKN